ncbi:MAG: hypothetical protein JRH20_21685 [Deltaproteobacteria bacterium]|nr:hypothetical protein [Deltaproteobacteria bacterium]
MNGLHKALIFCFLAIIFSVPLSQAVFDWRSPDEDKPVALTLFDHAPTERHLREYEDRLEKASFYQQQLRPVFQLYRYLALREMGDKAVRGLDGWTFYRPGLDYLVQPYWRKHTAQLGDNQVLLSQRSVQQGDPVATIADFAAQLKKRGVELLVVPMPGKASIYPDKLVEGLKPAIALTGHTRRLARELRQKGVMVFEMQRAFVEARSKKNCPQLYMRSDTHWTGHGVKLGAEKLAAWVKARPWFSSLKKMPRYTRKEVQVERRGDIPRMTRVPQLEKLFPADKVTAFRVFHKESGEPYEEPEEFKDAPILLLGDSFARVFETDAPEAAGVVSNLAYELQQPLLSIVNDGGASTLVRQELSREIAMLAGKKLVIWLFVERDVRFGLKGWKKFQL